MHFFQGEVTQLCSARVGSNPISRRIILAKLPENDFKSPYDFILCIIDIGETKVSNKYENYEFKS